MYKWLTLHGKYDFIQESLQLRFGYNSRLLNQEDSYVTVAVDIWQWVSTACSYLTLEVDILIHEMLLCSSRWDNLVPRYYVLHIWCPLCVCIVVLPTLPGIQDR